MLLLLVILLLLLLPSYLPSYQIIILTILPILLLSCREKSRSKDETRPENYLTTEFEERISQEGVRYKLQIQLHEINPDDSHLILHASRVWDKATHPWLDLANVKLTSLLPCDVVSDTRCSMGNIPSSIVIPPAKTIYDYTSLGHLRSKIYPGSNTLACRKPSSNEGENLSIYCISVTTGDRKGAGTDANVSLTITGKIRGVPIECVSCKANNISNHCG